MKLKKRDIKFRQNYYLNEKRYFLLKSIQSNQFMPYSLRLDINLKLNKLTKNSKSKIRNLCLITNKTNSIYRPFNLIRHSFRKNALNGELIGIKKSSW